jgi:hypothetical protein
MGGFRIPMAGPSPTVPWVNVNQVVVQFDQPVRVQASDLSIHGVRSSFSATAIEPLPQLGHAYLFTLDATLGDGDLGGDRLVIDVNGERPDGVTAVSGGLLLDGDNDGAPGGSMRARFDVSPGDTDRGGAVLANDFSDVKRKFFSTTANRRSGPAAYSVFHDVDGSGAILADDFSEVKKRFFQSLPPSPSQSAGSMTSRVFATDLIAPAVRSGPADELLVAESGGSRSRQEPFWM